MSDPIDVPAVCLGCGCLCDDVRLTIADGRIGRIENCCPPGERWFGDGTLPAVIRCGDVASAVDDAVRAAADLLFAEPGRLLVYVAGDVSCEVQRAAAGLADVLGASIDGPAAETVAEGLLAAQRRGRASATLGELRHRADLVLFWGVDPKTSHPRFMERFVFSTAMHATRRTLLAVDVGADHGPAGSDERVSLAVNEEVDALSVMRAALKDFSPADVPPSLAAIAEVARRLAVGLHYVAVVFDAEPPASPRDAARVEGLIALVQQLNSHTRAALFGLRAGGNRNGLESVLTWQTGYPFAVDFGSGAPAYQGDESTAARLARDRYSVALVIGSPATVPEAVREQLGRLPCVAVGPRASTAAFAPQIAIDTGLAGLHEGGLLLRMDDVPIPAQARLRHPHSTIDVLQRLLARVPATAEVA